jgi:hypothetical protein
LGILYLLTLLTAVVQIIRIVFHRHNIFHYQFVFLVLCLFWGAVRVAFLPFVGWEEQTELVLNGLAIVIQFATFSFVVLFYAQMVHRSYSRYLDRVVLIVYIIINIIILGLYIGTCFLKTYELNIVQSILNGSAYVILSIAISAYGFKLHTLISSKIVKVPFLKNLSALVILTCILTFVFLFRAIWNFLLAAERMNPDLHVIPVILIACPCPKWDQQLIAVVLFLIWEIIPSLIILAIFWKIPKAKRIKPFKHNQPNMFISYGGAYTPINAEGPSETASKL